LLYGVADDRAAPNDGIAGIVKEDIHGHNLNSRFRFNGNNTGLIAASPFCKAECGRNGRARNIGIQNSRFITVATHLNGHQRGDEGFADTALAADYGNNVLYMCPFMRRRQKALRLMLSGAAAAATGAVLTAALFTHYNQSPLSWTVIFFSLPILL